MNRMRPKNRLMSKKRKSRSTKRQQKNCSIALSLTFLVLGFLFAFSYRTLGTNENHHTYQPLALVQEERYREELIQQQERNKQLRDEVNEKTRLIRQKEFEMSKGTDSQEKLVQEAKRLRLVLGDLPAVGEGVSVTLKDAAYDPSTQNPNDYIVHESHVLRVVNELKITGAEGIAINGHRLHANSSIKCTGPVITIDGKTSPEPFVIEAVGSQKTLLSALQLKGGIVDWLKGDNIVVEIEAKTIQLPEIYQEGVIR